MGEARRTFNNDLEGHLFRATLRAFNRGDERVDGIDVLGAADFGDHDLVKALARLFQQVHHIAVPIGCVERVDPHGERFGSPVDRVDCLNNIGAGRLFVGWGHGVLKVEVDHIRV